MLFANRFRMRPETCVLGALALVLGLGWVSREIAFAQEKAKEVASGTFLLSQVKPADQVEKGELVGRNGVYIAGDTPGSSKFATGRYELMPGKSPHPPHVHPEEEVMVIESGEGEILCDGKTTKIGPGSVMFTTPNVEHGINNTGDKPIVFYYIKWATKDAK
ncbi:cupin domain-containing protein [Singulisphaera sp. PoT]|uniref:cupin domain-containing protein n=1 Tax=Singulisphaera sp. PoT TaxID=3411797 RepID=UPI003BF548BC